MTWFVLVDFTVTSLWESSWYAGTHIYVWLKAAQSMYVYTYIHPNEGIKSYPCRPAVFDSDYGETARHQVEACEHAYEIIKELHHGSAD